MKILGKFDYVSIDDDQKQKIEDIRSKSKELATLFNVNCPDGRGKAIAYTKLEEALYWANKSICGND